MTHIENIESLENNLDKGLGLVYEGGFFSLPPEGLRLRMKGMCGVASIALKDILHERGIASELVLSNPGAATGEELGHVFLVTHDETVIDPVYTAFIEYAGVLPFDVGRGDIEDIYPERKIAEFQLGDSSVVVQGLVATAVRALTLEPRFDKYDRRHYVRPELEGKSEEEIGEFFAAFWDSRHFGSYAPPQVYFDKGRWVADIVLAEEASRAAA